MTSAPATVRAALDCRAERAAGEPFLLDPASGRTVSYGDARDAARALAARIAARGTAPSESVQPIND